VHENCVPLPLAAAVLALLIVALVVFYIFQDWPLVGIVLILLVVFARAQQKKHYSLRTGSAGETVTQTKFSTWFIL
jgi:uncharacterized membrane protein YdbT with pleckstrin-like domain